MDTPFAFVIEDDDMLATFFESALQDAGFKTQIIHDGDEALVELKTAVPHLILLDLQLPGANGETILKTIRSDQRFDDTRIFMTSVEGTRAGFYQGMVDMILVKPVSYQQLRTIAQRMLPNATP
ncbi:MAG: response regulator [Chloroflexi bacterium]|nr:MAG: response regulator [Chloroflexota bacterium]